MQININDYLDKKVINLDQAEYEMLYLALKSASNNAMFVMTDEIDDRMQSLLNKLPTVRANDLKRFLNDSKNDPDDMVYIANFS